MLYKLLPDIQMAFFLKILQRSDAEGLGVLFGERGEAKKVHLECSSEEGWFGLSAVGAGTRGGMGNSASEAKER